MTESFEKTKLAGSIASGALDEINNLIKPGITTAEIDDFCFNYIMTIKVFLPHYIIEVTLNHVVHQQIILFAMEYHQIKF